MGSWEGQCKAMEGLWAFVRALALILGWEALGGFAQRNGMI